MTRVPVLWGRGSAPPARWGFAPSSWGRGSAPPARRDTRAGRSPAPTVRWAAALPAVVLLALVLLLLGVLCGCAARQGDPPTLTVGPGPFEIRIPARGELRAETTTPITIPQTLPGAQTVSWLAADGATVRAGDPVARLDDSLLAVQSREAGREVSKLQASIGAQGTQHGRERDDLAAQVGLVREEARVVSTFAPRDPEIYSRNEIIDSQVSLDLLERKATLYEGKRGRQQKKHRTDAQLLELQRDAQAVRVTQAGRALSSLELQAPHDGLFLRHRNWRGEPVAVGSTVWGSQPVGELPDLSRMEARVHVLESEAPGLAAGLEAEVVLDAAPARTFKARVKTLGAVAQPIEDESPVKYFEVILALDATDTALMRPGQQVQAAVFVARRADAIAVPNQAVFHKGDETWVFVRGTGGGTGAGAAAGASAGARGWTRRSVTLGERSLTRTVVTKGLAAGDVIALADPEAGS